MKDKGQSFHYGKDGHQKRNYKIFLTKKAKMKLDEASSLFMIDLCFSVNMDCAWVLDIRCASNVCNILQVLKTHRMLAEGEVDLRMDNGARVTTVVVREVNLRLASRHILVLDTCYYVSSFIKNIISIY